MINRIPSGVPGFDELVEGGFEQKSVSLLVGAPGTGKSTFALQFLYEGAVHFNEPGLLLSFSETPESIMEHSLNFGWDFEKLEKENKFRVISLKPHQISSLLQSGGGRIRDEVESLGVKRIVVDSVTAYSLLFKDDYLKRESIVEFFTLFRDWGLTSLVISEASPKAFEQQEGSIGFFADAILHFYYLFSGTQERTHCVEVYKMRGTHHANRLYELFFQNSGVTVKPLSSPVGLPPEKGSEK